jgi:RNA polymerase sigma factor (sigma-70 family)
VSDEPAVGEIDAWVLATSPRAVAYATALLRDRERAEDVVQDCYCRLLRKAHEYDLPSDGLKILLKAVSHACINARSRERRFWSLSGRRWGDEKAFDVVDRSAEEPERQMMNEELAAAIGRGLAGLPVQQGAALELKSQGHSLEEIGEILDINANHAGVLVHRAREAMKARLAAFLGGQAR